MERISDHYAIPLSIKPLTDKIDNPTLYLLYHKGNMASLKSDLSDLQLQFLTGDPYSNSVESNWNKIKETVSDASWVCEK